MNALVDAFGLREKLDEQALISAWDNVAGPMIARHTTRLQYRAGVLRVKVRLCVVWQLSGMVVMLRAYGPDSIIHCCLKSEPV